MSTAGALALLVSLFLFAVALLFAMAFLFAQVTGWRGLARRHPAIGPFEGPRFRVEGAILGPLGWNAPPLSLGIDRTGVDLRALPPFAVAFRPIRLPWSAISTVVRREALLFSFVELRYGIESRATIGFVGSPALVASIEDGHAAATSRACTL
jgi:hypothetical protein